MSIAGRMLYLLCAAEVFFGAVSSPVFAAAEPEGPSSRRTALAITEIMYDPADAAATNGLQFVELHNAGIVTEDLTGHRLTGDISYQFPAGTLLPANGYLVVAKKPATFQSHYGAAALGPFSGDLPNDGGTVRVVNEIGARILEVDYDTKGAWPVAADGAGHSLVLRRPSYGENDPRAWDASDLVGGSPGAEDVIGAEPARNVVLNEFLAHTDAPLLDFVELYNHGNAAVDLSGCTLSDKVNTNRYTFPTNTTLAARGFLKLDETQLGFALSAAGGKIIFRNAAGTRVLDAVNYDGQENGVATGRFPDGGDQWYRLAAITGGAANAAIRLEDVVLNELMYEPISGNRDDQYVELHNRSAAAVDLSGWKLKDGIGYTVPAGTILPAGGYLVIARNATNLIARYPQLSAINTLGNFSGSLAGRGERVALTKPDTIISTNGLGQAVTNKSAIVVDEVTYSTGGRWPVYANGGGSSLELVDPRADRRQPSNWAASDESNKALWTTIDVTDPLVNGMSSSRGTPNRIEIFMQGPGEVLLDDLELRNNNGSNRISDSNFENDGSGFGFGGTHRNSFVQSGVGIGGSKALHVVATDRGDAGPNKIYSYLSSTLTTGSTRTGTLRAKARWLKGSPLVMFRTRGHWMEVATRLDVPANLGTPGLTNSRRIPNAGPAISGVAHSPILPAAGESVVVSARVQDPDGVASVTLFHRVDPATTSAFVTMKDDGTGGDAVAGDGIYSATLPGQAAGKLVAFRVEASDSAASPAGSVFPATAPVSECLVRWGDLAIGGRLGIYRIWITEATRSFWAAREKNANDPMDCTFVYGDSRVVYGVNTLYSGSPFHTRYANYNGPTGQTCDYELNFQPDEPFLGAKNFVLSAVDAGQGGTFFPDGSSQGEVTGNWIARKLGLPSNHKRHVHVVVNGLRRGTVYEDSQQPNGEYLKGFFPNDENGQLRKIEDWFEFSEDAITFDYTTATLERFTLPNGAIDTKRYRWTWRPRATDTPDDWSGFTNLVQAMNTPGTGPGFVDAVLQQVDVRQFLGSIAVHHICGDWDSYGYERGKNSFVYRPDDGRWVTLLWDVELGLGSSESRPPSDGIYRCHDPVLQKMLDGAPAFQREYLGLMQDAVDGPLDPAISNPILDERYAALRANNAFVTAPTSIKNYMLLRRAYLQSVIPAAAFSVTAPTTSSVPSITLSGTAPVKIRTLVANGQLLPVAWSSTTAWTAPLLLASGSNWVQLAAYDAQGQLVASTNLALFTTAVVNWPALRINEWMASNGGALLDPADNDADDWFELYNPTATNVSLAGWSLTDNPTNASRFIVPAGYSVPAGGYLLVWADEELNQNTNTRPDLHADFKLAKEGESIALYAPDGTLVDRVDFGAQTQNVSEGRWPNGSAYIEAQLHATPGATNSSTLPAVPVLESGLTGGSVAMTFNTKAGFRYQLQSRDNLEEGTWENVDFPVTATGSSLTLSDSIGFGDRRFYRVVLLP